MSTNTLNRGEVALFSPADLRSLLEGPEKYALDTHTHSVRATIEHAPVRYYHKADALRLSIEQFADFTAALGDRAVKSATMSFTLFEDDISTLRNDRSDKVWEVKKPKFHSASDRIRFFVAKTALGDMQLGDGTAARIIERRTYAGIGVGDDVDVRQIDIQTVLGVAGRHENDTRGDVLISPTSQTHYAYKLESGE